MQNNWISCEEQMPPTHKYVLIALKWGQMLVAFWEEDDIGLRWYSSNSDHEIHPEFVTDWMNLPIAPNGKIISPKEYY